MGEPVTKAVYIVSYNLQFFAKEGPGGEKTEEATPKKLTNARSEGQVAKSNELITASALITLFIVLKITVGYLGKRFLEVFNSSFQMIDEVANSDFTVKTSTTIINNAIKSIILICMPFFIASMAVAFVVVLYQVKWKVSNKLLKPKLNRLNIISGFKRFFSKEKAIELVLSLMKIGIITYLVYITLKDEWVTLIKLYDMKLEQAFMLIGDIVINLGLKISIVFLLIGFADLFYQKRKFRNDMKMTKQEVKDEYKNSEGDPLIKSKIRSKMREISMRRMMQNLPTADVVITNPTHLATAIKYDKEASEAPILIAKGADYLAQKIKEVAKENNIEIVENKPLARMLYYNVEVGAQVPPELYQMTAEVLAYVYKLKDKL